MAESLSDFRSFVERFRVTCLCVDLDFFLNAELAIFASRLVWFGSTDYLPFHVRCRVQALLPHKRGQHGGIHLFLVFKAVLVGAVSLLKVVGATNVVLLLVLTVAL